jgi:hypothetical protein
MTAPLLVIALFAGWSLIGLGLLSLVRADTHELRIVLTAPSIGACVTLLTIFPASEAGAAIASCAVPIAIGLPLGAVLVIALRRPRLHPGAFVVAGVCVAGLLLTAWPMFSLGFHWLANGNDDMSNYVLSAQDLLKRGVLASLDIGGLIQGRDYATVFVGQHLAGSRPGSDMLLAFVSQLTGRPPYETFMSTILAFELCCASAVGALAMQFARRWWAAPLAAGLLLVSPLASYGVVQELLAQTWGLGVAVALLALLMRPELHSGRGARLREVIPIGILTTGLVLGYVELASQIGLTYVAYVAILGARRRLGLSALARLWLPVLAIVVVVLNSYFFTELGFLHAQSAHGLSAGSYPPLFGYVFVPSALPGVVGLQMLPPGSLAPHLDLTIALAMVLIVGALIGSVLSAYSGAAAAVVLVVDAALAVLLATKSSDFGLFKLAMYVQPFLVAALAIWLANTRKRAIQSLAALLLAALALAMLSSQHAYVEASENPGDVPNLSAADMIPAFHTVAAQDPGPIVSITENPVLIKLEAASAEGRPVYFQSRDVFSLFVSEYLNEISSAKRVRTEHALRSRLWIPRSFDLMTTDGAHDPFEEDPNATLSIKSGRCELSIAGPSEVPFNRYALPSSSPNLIITPCRAPRDLLAFTSSELGESFYLPKKRYNISFYQFQGDPFAPERTMAGFGRYALFQVLGPTSGERMVVELTNTFDSDGSNLLPPAAVVGASRLALPLEGRGSARVFSPPLTPQTIAGTPYVLLDMGIDGKLPFIKRSGLQGIYGKSVPTDPNYLTTFVKDISLVSAAQYADLRPPTAVSSFPGSLENPNLEYAGLYEDGWIGERGYVRLAGGPAADLLTTGEVPVGAGGHLLLLVNGHPVYSAAVASGKLRVRVPVPASSATRRLEFRFAKTIKLKAPDLRPAAAHLAFLGFVPRTGR